MRRTIDDCVAAPRIMQNAYLIDWYAYSKDHPGWFFDDGLPSEREGARYAAPLAHKVG